jgi:hypothetical protein
LSLKSLQDLLQRLPAKMRLIFLTTTFAVYNTQGNSGSLLFIYTHQQRKRRDFDSYPELTRCCSSRVDILYLRSQFDFVLFLLFLFASPILLFWIPSRFLALLLAMKVRRIGDMLAATQYSGIITFCDALPDDHFISSYFASKGKTTYTFQHGIYYLSKRARVENIALKYFVSDYMFCWGETSIVEAQRIGIKPSRFIQIGKVPNITGSMRTFSGISDRKIVVVHLNSRKDTDINIKMLECVRHACEQLQLPYTATTHRDDDISRYYGDLGPLFELMSNATNYDYANVIYSSGVAYDLWFNKKPVFVFDDADGPQSFLAFFPSFRSPADFIDRLCNNQNRLVAAPFAFFSAADFSCVLERASLDLLYSDSLDDYIQKGSDEERSTEPGATY